MLQKVVDYVVNHPNALEDLKNNKLNFAGVSELEKTALLDVLNDQDEKGLEVEMCYWK